MTAARGSGQSADSAERLHFSLNLPFVVTH